MTVSLLVALVLVAVINAAATALRSASRFWITQWIDQRLAGATEESEASLDRQQRLLEAGTLASVVVIAVAGVALGLSADGPWRVAAQALIYAMLIVVAGQIVPRAMARRWATRLVPVAMPLLRALSAALAPISRLADVLARPFARRTARAEAESPAEEIEDLLREDELEGSGQRAELDIITGVVEFGEKPARDVMTPRTAVFALDEETHPREMARLIAQAGYSRVPIYRGSLDEIVGMVHVFDVLRTRGESAPELRPVAHAPGTKRCSELLFTMLGEQLHLAVVLDEFGGTAGIVTLEDLLEELVGDIRDEHDEPESAPVEASARAAVVEGDATLQDVLRRLGAPLRDGDGRMSQPVGGLLASALGRVPAVGERFRVSGLELVVIDAEPARVTRILAQLAEHATPVDLPAID